MISSSNLHWLTSKICLRRIDVSWCSIHKDFLAGHVRHLAKPASCSGTPLKAAHPGGNLRRPSTSPRSEGAYALQSVNSVFPELLGESSRTLWHKSLTFLSLGNLTSPDYERCILYLYFLVIKPPLVF